MPKRDKTRIPRIIRLVAINGALGALVGFAAAAGIVAADAGGIATLMDESGSYVAASTLLFGSFTITFATFSIASAVMLLPRD